MSAAVGQKVVLPIIGEGYVQEGNILYVSPNSIYASGSLPSNWGKPGGVTEIQKAPTQEIFEAYVHMLITIVSGINDATVSLKDMHITVTEAEDRLKQVSRSHFVQTQNQLREVKKDIASLQEQKQQLKIIENEALEKQRAAHARKQEAQKKLDDYRAKKASEAKKALEAKNAATAKSSK